MVWIYGRPGAGEDATPSGIRSTAVTRIGLRFAIDRRLGAGPLADDFREQVATADYRVFLAS